MSVFLKFYKICKDYKPDVIHCWDGMTAIYSIPACKLLHIKFVNGMVVDTPVKRNIFNKHWFLAKLTFHFPAWSCGIPVLSLFVDPGGIIKKEELGDVTHGNPDKLLLAMENSVNTVEFANRAKAYVENDHVLNAKKIKEVSFLFSDLFNNGK